MKAVLVAALAGMAGCAFAQPVVAGGAAKYDETVVWSFGGGTGGTYPNAGLIDVKGTLYGTTDGGGTNCISEGGCGTAFSLDPKTGAENVLHSFGSGADGAYPEDSLIDMNGTLYGTTDEGGGNGGCGSEDGCGTVFSLDPKTGAESVLYSFCSQQPDCADGAFPAAGLLDVDGTLYGTTEFGGVDSCMGVSCGTVFSIDPATGAESVVHTFCSRKSCADGGEPAGTLIDVNGTLYGTTSVGGANCQADGGCGTVFSLDPGTGAETVLYSFCSQSKCTDGAIPYDSLVDVNGTLYGTTFSGGAEGYGVAFALDPGTGAETVLHSFCSQRDCYDGESPYAGLIAVKGVLYGTTYSGGFYQGVYGYGTVFALDPGTGKETVLYAFLDSTAGKSPLAGLLDVKGTFYGMTPQGGANGEGTVFALTRNR
jgi:uncharacterized repeat protein (TIGR03803 family)